MAHTSPGYPDSTQGPGPGVSNLCPEQGWQAKYLRCRENYRAAKATIRLQVIFGCGDSDKRFARNVFRNIGGFFSGARYHALNIFPIFSD